MRTAISTLGVLAAVLLVAACFDPTRTCSTDADCVDGSCDPGTKTCISGTNPGDKVPPTFSIALSPAAVRNNTGLLSEADPGSPDGGVGAYRRDESVLVTVTAPDTDVDAGSVRLHVVGIQDGGTGGLVVTNLPPCTSTPSGMNFCVQASGGATCA